MLRCDATAPDDGSARFFWQKFSGASAASGQERVPLILLHDSLGSVAQWRDFPRELAASCQRPVIAYDRLGHGRSPPAQRDSSLALVEREADFLLTQVLPSFGISRFMVFGHSVGGAMAAVVTAKSQTSCVALITEGAQAFFEDKTAAGIQAVQKSAAPSRLIERLQRYHGDKAQTVFDSWIESWFHPAAATWSLEPWLASVVAPTLAIHGDLDEYGSMRHLEMIADGVAGVSRRLVLEGVGHVPHRECMALVLDEVARFLRDFAD